MSGRTCDFLDGHCEVTGMPCGKACGAEPTHAIL